MAAAEVIAMTGADQLAEIVRPQTPGPTPTHQRASYGLVAASLTTAPLLGKPQKFRMLSAAAVRQRRKRQRKDDGKLRVELILDDTLLDALVALKWFGEWDRDDPKAVAQALLDGLREAACHA